MTRHLCPRFHRAIELIGGRWTGPILQVLLSGPARFAELAETIPDISDRMLSERLRELEAEGLVARSVLPLPPIRVEYALTSKGRELQVPLEAVGRWAERWIALPSASAGGSRVVERTRRRGAVRAQGKRGTAASRDRTHA